MVGFFKGLTPPLIAETLYNCVYFGAYSLAKDALQPDRTRELTIGQIALAGSFSGVRGFYLHASLKHLGCRVGLCQPRRSCEGPSSDQPGDGRA